LIVCLLQSNGYITLAYRDAVDIEDIYIHKAFFGIVTLHAHAHISHL